MARIIDEELGLYARDVGIIIRRIMRKLRSPAMAFKEEAEISQPQAMLLTELQETGTSSMSELSRRLMISQGVVTRMVDRLVEKGMVERERGSGDRRVVFVSLSKKGKDFAEKMIEYYREKIRTIFLEVPGREREDFLELLKRIDQQLEQE